MFIKQASQSPFLCMVSYHAPTTALLSSGVVDNQPFHKVTLGGTHNCITRLLMVRRRRLLLVRAVDKESQAKYDFDQEKAKQSLNELDQQLDSLLKKPVPQSKIKASNLTDTLQDEMKEEESDFSGAWLAYGGLILFSFTIFYNILFLTVIKPSIDIPDEVDEQFALVREGPSSEIVQQMFLPHLLTPDTVVGEL